ncbi:hypothetical protein JD844_000721 [Phrynosoma platyrhinos]|uniref:Ragulator complex protein LAMTOR4 n=1 Tax=Phrynosoma platyrhinos TaxID=52577 RepID=A0ABQ7T8G5_PHRPL|nr:hypothetical protein JD844_000721 [Phrynosoma platyrhinos]
MAATMATATAALTQGLERVPDQTGYLVICDGAVLAVMVFGEHSFLVTISGQKLFVVKRQNSIREPVAV